MGRGGPGVSGVGHEVAVLVGDAGARGDGVCLLSRHRVILLLLDAYNFCIGVDRKQSIHAIVYGKISM